MYIEAGTTLYRYSIRYNRFSVCKGVVNEVAGRRKVVFAADDVGKAKSVRCPREEDIGIIRNVGPSLWLYERDDELAKQIFIDHEMYQINGLTSLIERKKKTVEMLRGKV